MCNAELKSEIKKSKNVSSGIQSYAKILRVMFESASSKQIAKIVIENISENFFQSMHDVLSLEMKLENDRMNSTISVLQLTITFCCLENEIGIESFQKNVITKHLNPINYEFTNDFFKLKAVCEVILEKNEHFLGR